MLPKWPSAWPHTALLSVVLGTVQIKIIQALAFWNLDADPEMWTEEEVFGIIQHKEAEHNFEKLEVDLIDPGRCQQTDVGWDVLQTAFMNKLSASMGAAKVPVAYVVRTDVDDAYVFDDNEERWM
jgi:hypothetical protein